jgi:hypothetical protein
MTTTIESTVPVTTTAEKTFTVAGVSCLKGEYKVRHANNLDRVKVLDKNDHTDVRLIELPYAMTKLEAVQYLISLPTNDEIEDTTLKTYFDDIDAQQAFDDFLSAKSPKPPKPAKAPKEPKVKKAVAEVVEDLVETPVDLTDLYESVGLVPPTVYEDAVAEEEVDTEDQPF